MESRGYDHWVRRISRPEELALHQHPGSPRGAKGAVNHRMRPNQSKGSRSCSLAQAAAEAREALLVSISVLVVPTSDRKAAGGVTGDEKEVGEWKLQPMDRWRWYHRMDDWSAAMDRCFRSM